MLLPPSPAGLLLWVVLLAALLVPAGVPAAAQGGSPPLSRDHWGYELLEALDAAGVGNGWANDIRPVSRAVVGDELRRMSEVDAAPGWVDAWATRFDREHPAGRRSGGDHRFGGNRSVVEGELGGLGRFGSPFLDGNGDGVLTRLRAAALPGERLALWGELNLGDDPRSAFDDVVERAGVTLDLGPFSWTVGRLRPEAPGPATTSTHLGGEVPLEGLYVVSDERVALPWLEWLLGPTAWQGILAPWNGIDDTSGGWFGLTGISAQPHERLRISFTRSARFGGDEAGEVTAGRLFRLLTFQANEPTFWDDQRMDVSVRFRWPTPASLPLATYVVVAQDDSPLWKDPGLLAGATVPLLRRWGLLHLRYEYLAHGARAAWCPFCELARGQQVHRFQGEWYRHVIHGPFRPEGVPAGSPLGGYGASHTVGGSYFHPSGAVRGRTWAFFQVREEGNVLLDRWPGKRRGAGVEVSWAPPGGGPLGADLLPEVTGGLLYHQGDQIESDLGGWLHVSVTAGGWRVGVPVEEGTAVLSPRSLSPGDRVRVRSTALPSGRAEGSVVGFRDRTLLLDLGDGEPTALPPESIERVRVRTGEHRATLRGALVGGVVGLLTAFIVEGADEADDEIDPECGELECYGTGFFVGMTAGGTAIGAGIGTLFTVPEWEDVPLGGERVGVRLRARPGGTAEIGVELGTR